MKPPPGLDYNQLEVGSKYYIELTDLEATHKIRIGTIIKKKVKPLFIKCANARYGFLIELENGATHTLTVVPKHGKIFVDEVIFRYIS